MADPALKKWIDRILEMHDDENTMSQFVKVEGVGRTLVLCLDGSSSMHQMFQRIQTFLNTMTDVLRANGITHLLLIIFSDYEGGSFIDVKVKPAWWNNSIGEMTPEQAKKAGELEWILTKDPPKGVARHEQFLTEVGKFRNVDIELIRMIVWSSLEEDPVETAETTTDAEKVFTCLNGSIDEVVSKISAFKVGHDLGYGGDFPEAHATALLVALVATGGNCDILFLGDAPPHWHGAPNNGQTETSREQATFRGLGFEDVRDDYVQRIFKVASMMGARVISLCSGRNYGNHWMDSVAPHTGNGVIYKHNLFNNELDTLKAMVTALSILMGDPQMPLTGTPEQLQEFSAKSGQVFDGTKYANGIHISVYGEPMKTLRAPSIKAGDIERNTQIFHSFMVLLEKFPEIAPILGPLASVFYKAKGTLGDVEFQQFQALTTGLQKKHGKVVYALYTIFFTNSRTHNVQELEDALTKMYNEIGQTGQYVLVFTGDDELNPDFFRNVGMFLTGDMIAKIKKVASSFKIMSIEDAIKQGCYNPEAELLDRTYLPAEIVGGKFRGKFLNLIWALAMGNKSMPPQTVSFKVALIMYAYFTQEDIISQLRLEAALSARDGIMKALSADASEANKSLLAWLISDFFKPREDKNPMTSYVKWWTQPIAMIMLIKVLESMHLHVPKTMVGRVKILHAIVALQKRLGDTFETEFTKSTGRLAKAGRLVKCIWGELMPETHLFANGSCAYCTGIHGEKTEEGLPNPHAGEKYHYDGTPSAQTTPGYPEGVCVDPNMDVQCSVCASHYSIMDGSTDMPDGTKRGCGNNPLKCFNCRTGRRIGKKSPVRTCKVCNDKWVFCSEQKDWICCKCEHLVALTQTQTYHGSVKVTLAELMTTNPSVLEGIAKSYGLTIPVVKLMLKKYTAGEKLMEDILLLGLIRKPSEEMLVEIEDVPSDAYQITSIPSGKKITSMDWPFANSHTADDFDVTLNPEPTQKALTELKETRGCGECDLGVCGIDSFSLVDLVNPCGECSFRVCKGCLSHMVRRRNGCVVPFMQMSCPCGRGICQKALDAIGKPEFVAGRLLRECAERGDTNKRIGFCCGGHYEGEFKKLCRGNRTVLLEPFEGGCGEAQPDVTDFRCRQCSDAEDRFQIHMAKLEQEAEARRADAMQTTEQDIDMMKKAFPAGTPIRRCPDCDYPSIFASWGACAHMTCPKCRGHWCWICGTSCGTAGNCYTHMDDEYDGHEYAYEIQLDTPLTGDGIEYATGDGSS